MSFFDDITGLMDEVNFILEAHPTFEEMSEKGVLRVLEEDLILLYGYARMQKGDDPLAVQLREVVEDLRRSDKKLVRLKR